MKQLGKAMIPGLAALTLTLTGCGPSNATGVHPAKNHFVIGFDNGYIGNTWRAQYVADAKAAATKLEKKGLISKFIVESNDANVSSQLSQLNSMIDEGVNALMIDPVSPTALAPIIKKAQAKHILVVITNDPAAYKNTYDIIGNNTAFWEIETKWIVNQLHGKGNIVEITGVPGNTANTLRVQEADKILKHYPGIHVLGSAPGKWDPSVAESVMSTFLSTFNNINGVLEQDVEATGTIQAYKAAGKPLPVMTGDYTFQFLREWAKNYPHLDSIGVSYAPGDVVDALNMTVKLLQGYHFKPGVLGPNPLDPSLKNTFEVNPPYVVTKHAEPNAPWLKGISDVKAISLAQAVAIGHGKPASAALDGWMSPSEISAVMTK